MHTYLRSYDEPEIRRDEIIRYAGAKGGSAELDFFIDSCLSELFGKLTYKVCYTELDVIRDRDALCFGNIKSTSDTLKRKLCDSEKVIVFAATVGIEIDRLIARYSRVSPSRALILQAIGAERIEALCDAFCKDIGKEKEREGKSVTSRVSPGYSDIPITMQKDIFTLLDCPRRLGLTLNECLIMSPTKSVSAIFGVH